MSYATPGRSSGRTASKTPVYQIDFTAVASGKRVASTKRRVRWRFGFANVEALEAGQTGTECRGEEHDITLVWSITSGKRLVLADGQEVHYSNSRNSIFEFSWTMRGNHVLKIVAHASPPISAQPGFRQYDFFVDGQSFFYMPKVYRLGLTGKATGERYTHGSATRSNAPPKSGPAPISEIETPHNPVEEQAYLEQAIKESLKASAPTKVKPPKQPTNPAPPPVPSKEPDLLLDLFGAPPAAAPMASVPSFPAQGGDQNHVFANPQKLPSRGSFNSLGSAPQLGGNAAEFGNMTYQQPQAYGNSQANQTFQNFQPPNNFGAPLLPQTNNSFDAVGNSAQALAVQGGQSLSGQPYSTGTAMTSFATAPNATNQNSQWNAQPSTQVTNFQAAQPPAPAAPPSTFAPSTGFTLEAQPSQNNNGQLQVFGSDANADAAYNKLATMDLNLGSSSEEKNPFDTFGAGPQPTLSNLKAMTNSQPEVMKPGALVVSNNQQGNWANSLPSPVNSQVTTSQMNNGYSGYSNQMPQGQGPSSFGAPPSFGAPAPGALSAPNNGYGGFQNQQVQQFQQYQQQQQFQNPQLQQGSFPQQQIQQSSQPQQYQQPNQGFGGPPVNQGQF